MSDPSKTDLLEGDMESNVFEEHKGRICVGGFAKGPCIALIVVGVLAVIIAIAFPAMFMGVAPGLTQTAVDATRISLHNITISQWLYPVKDYTKAKVCEAYHPAVLTIIQDILFSEIPGFASMAPAQILPGTVDVLYNGTKFAELSLPEIDLSHPDNHMKWANGTVCTMKVTDGHGFIDANRDILPYVGKGKTIWRQVGTIVMRQNMAGIISYYSANMDQEVEVTEPAILDGPMKELNIFEALPCLTGSGEEEEEPAADTADDGWGDSTDDGWGDPTPTDDGWGNEPAATTEAAAAAATTAEAAATSEAKPSPSA